MRSSQKIIILLFPKQTTPMNQDLAQIVTWYSTKPHADFNNLLLSKSKDNLISILTDLLTSYINDRNSSSLRDFITVSIAGYEHSDKKLGYNGFKHNTLIGAKPIACEAKPKNIQTDGYEDKKTKSKLNGEGGFSDYHRERLDSDLRENPNLLSSGFVDGQLIYILEFPYTAIHERLKDLVDKRFGDEVRESGQYIRSATFKFGDYKQDEKLKIIYVNLGALKNNKKYINKELYEFLISK